MFVLEAIDLIIPQSTEKDPDEKTEEENENLV